MRIDSVDSFDRASSRILVDFRITEWTPLEGNYGIKGEYFDSGAGHFVPTGRWFEGESLTDADGRMFNSSFDALRVNGGINLEVHVPSNIAATTLRFVMFSADTELAKLVVEIE